MTLVTKGTVTGTVDTVFSHTDTRRRQAPPIVFDIMRRRGFVIAEAQVRKYEFRCWLHAVGHDPRGVTTVTIPCAVDGAHRPRPWASSG